MTKRLTNIDFVECYRAIFKDWLAIHPEDLSETVRDDKRIALEFSSRGLPFFTIDLPAIGKVLDRALSVGRLDRTPLAHMRRRKPGSSIPRFLQGFWIRLFDENGHLREDIDVTTVTFLRTILYLGKKLKVDCAPRYVLHAVKEYYDVEKVLPPSSILWETGFQGATRVRVGHLHDRCDRGSTLWSRPVGDDGDDIRLLRILSTCQQVADRIAGELGYIEDAEIRPRHGPGAVSETVTDGFKWNFPTWNPRLEEVLPFAEFGTHSVDSVLEQSLPVHYPRIEESASKLVDVPKTQKGPRLIAAEPVCNQWAQQGIANALRARVAKSSLKGSINFFDQTPSRDLAVEASRTGQLATIDLSSASDRLSTWLVQRVFRSNIRLLDLMAVSRTRYLGNPTWQDFPKLHKLRKFASMGSALTFPVQSIVFAILAAGYGSYHTGESYRKCLRRIRVFGDDIIVPGEWVDGFSSLLETLYLKVNRDKTYSRGFFRESCGMDAYRGYDVTPGYLRQPSGALYSRQALGYLQVINNLFLKGYWNLSVYLEKTVPWGKKLPAVNCLSSAFGLASFCSGLSPDLLSKVEWDENLHQDVIRVPRLIGKRPRASRVESWNGLSAFFFRPERDSVDWRRLFADERDSVSLDSVVESTSRMPALLRRQRVPVVELLKTTGLRVF